MQRIQTPPPLRGTSPFEWGGTLSSNPLLST